MFFLMDFKLHIAFNFDVFILKGFNLVTTFGVKSQRTLWLPIIVGYSQI